MRKENVFMNNDCLNDYNDSEIQTYFGESDESIKKCNKCKHLVYEDGTMTCDKINEKDD